MTIALVGCGHMGRAILEGWKAAGINETIIIYDPLARHGDPVFRGTELFNKPGDFMKSALRADTFVMAVKPQIMKDVCESIKPIVSKKTVILSIAAGKTIASFKELFSEEQVVIRTMPNTPAAIGKGVTAMVACNEATEKQKEKAEKLMAPTGDIEWVEDEATIDTISAISGSGPAYVFLMIEMLAKAGEKAGLDAKMSMRLARKTIIGSAALAESSDETAETLRKNVTSPGGTTEKALAVLMSGEVQKAYDEAVKAAIAKSKELAQ